MSPAIMSRPFPFTLHILVLVVALLLPTFVQAQQITSVAVSGTCGRFTVNVTADNLSGRCWDLKIDVPGQVLQPQTGDWKSSVYYVENALCPYKSGGSAGEKSLEIRPDSKQDSIAGKAKIRDENKVVEREFTIEQDCPAGEKGNELPVVWVLLITVFVVIGLFWAVGVWWKGKV
jgi:hypothetical protein